MLKTSVTLLAAAGMSVATALPVAAQVYDKVEVRGALTIPADDIRRTCGQLEGVYLDDIELDIIED